MDGKKGLPDAAERFKQILEEFLLNTMVGQFLIETVRILVAAFVVYCLMTLVMDLFMVLLKATLAMIRNGITR